MYDSIRKEKSIAKLEQHIEEARKKGTLRCPEMKLSLRGVFSIA
jgi:hypothetical protein